MEYQQVNVTGTKNIVDALISRVAETGQPALFVQASSQAVYGASGHQPIAEDSLLAPTSPYGESKVDAERVVAAAASTGALGAVCLRLSNVAGAVADRTDMNDAHIVPRTLAVAAGRGTVLEINGDGGAIRDFVHVQDVATAFLLALTACRAGACAVYNVGATAASMLDVITVAEQITGRSIPVTHNPPKEAEVRVAIADTTRIRSELSWVPARSSLSQIIGDAWAATLSSCS
jgi:UDP-glucose 4-epimerase